MSSAALKWIALVTMLVDHVAMFLPGMPQWMHWIGRLAAPLFLFCLAFSLEHTRSRRKFLLRLYLTNLVMGIGDFVAARLVIHPYAEMNNNFLSTLFVIALIVVLIEYYKEDKASAKQLAVVVLITEVISVILCFLFGSLYPSAHGEYLVNALLPNLFYCEGSFLIVIFGVFMYLYRKEKKYMISRYMMLCLAYAVIVFLQSGYQWSALFYDDCQWLMILAAPFMWAYNGNKGKSCKYLFYIVYPLHIWILFAIGNLI